MKKILFPFLFLLATTALWAQAPQRISYQSIIRDANKVVVASSPVGIKISLLQGTATGPAVYVETHRSTTNSNGLVSLEIGTGAALSGTFAGIDWSNGPYLIQTETDPTGGTNYSIPGIAALNSVPYALNAANSGMANKLAAPRSINGVLFDGSADITVTASAATLAGTLPIANGGTGATTATAARASLGLENVDNTSDANKPVSTAAQTALSNKVDKVTGKELSTNDYTTTEKAKLAAITGTNTGDQDLSAFATTAVVALKANSADVTNDLATKVDKVTGKELSTNDYSTTEKAKLAAITGTNTGDQVNIAGNAATATKLQATITINGIAFDGSSNVTIPATGAVPYTGATQAVDLGAYDLKVNGITFGRGNNKIDNNVAIGQSALSSTTTGFQGNYLTAVGFEALKNDTWGYFNTGIGSSSLYSNTTGLANTAVGSNSLYSNTTANFNTAVGAAALGSNTTGENNTASGAGSLEYNTTGEQNSAFGRNALGSNTTGSINTATGRGALSSNTAGGANTANGASALTSNLAGGGNTAMGNNALTNTNGSENTAIGNNAGALNTTGTNNTAIGGYANFGANNLTNATALGYGATVAASNTIQLGADGSNNTTAITNVKTSGTITAGTVTYPNTHGSANQVLSTTGSGTLAWTTPATGLPSSGNTAGDMLYWNGSAWVKVAAGSNGQTLTFNNGAPVWSNNPFANTIVSNKTGKTWMDRDLGASQVATSSTDHLAYGSFYQWGRGSDGHELITWSSSTAGTPVNGTTSTLSSSDVPVDGSFISAGNSDWRSTPNNNLWQGVSGTNNPCPAGFRIPTEAEWIAEINSWSSYNAAGAFASPLKLPVAGSRNGSGTFSINVGTAGNYWSSTIKSLYGGSYPLYIWFNKDTRSYTEGLFRAWGISVRCIKD